MLGSIIGAGASILGGILGSNSAKKTAQMNIKHQREFAQHGVRWKVADAKAAGIHPLYALGASTVPFSPVSGYTGDYGVSEAGQNIGRAIDAGSTRSERNTSFSRTANALTLERMGLQNDILKAELASKAAVIGQAGRAPPKPIANATAPTGDDTSNWWFGKKVAGIPGHDPQEVAEKNIGEMANVTHGIPHGTVQLWNRLKASHVPPKRWKHLPVAEDLWKLEQRARKAKWLAEKSSTLKRRYGYHGSVY